MVRPDSKSDTWQSVAHSVQFQSPPTMARAASCNQGSTSKNVALSSALAEAGTIDTEEQDLADVLEGHLDVDPAPTCIIG